jgi:hypothetical protein
MSFDLERYERAMAGVMLAGDPVAALEALPPDDRALLEPIDRDGLRIAALLVARLRFERLMNGSRAAADWFEEDPRAFTAAFKRYHTAVAPLSTIPKLEARAFEAWLTSAGARRPPA